MLETGDCSVEKIAEAVGFGSAQAFRHWFGAAVGVAPTAYRRSYRGTEPPEVGPA